MTAKRSELFLSCDLVGSTAYKQQKDAAWEEVFLAFYLQFPQLLGELAAEKNVPFQLWKPIGDELVYRVLVRSEAEVRDAVRVWLAAMRKYESDDALARKVGLSQTKGGAFIATFPGPDVEATALRDPTERLSSSIGLAEINDAAIATADHAKYIYDYFGPSFDTGFRVIHESTPRHFTLTAEVAWALLRANDDVPGHQEVPDLVFLGPRELKGVWNGRDYPLFAIDRDHGDEINSLMTVMVGGTTDLTQAKFLLEKCVMSEQWPSAMFLPDSSFAFLSKEPTDALEQLRRPRDPTSADAGIEEKPTHKDENRGRRALPPDAPTGDVVTPEGMMSIREASSAMGLTIPGLRGRMVDHAPLAHLRRVVDGRVFVDRAGVEVTLRETPPSDESLHGGARAHT